MQHRAKLGYAGMNIYHSSDLLKPFHLINIFYDLQMTKIKIDFDLLIFKLVIIH